MSPLKEFKGNAAATRLSAQLVSGATASFTVMAGGGSGFPAGATAPFVVVIDRGTALEEKVLVTTRSADTFSTLTRGYDDTTAQTHAAQAVVEHVLDAATLTEFMAHKYTDADPHPTYMTAAEVTAAMVSGFPAFQIERTWAVAGDILVPSGDVDVIPGIFVPEVTGWRTRLVRARHRIGSGTSATVKLQNNGVDITGFTGMVVGTTSTTTDPADTEITDLDYIAPIVTAVSGSPRNMSFSIFLEYDQV